MLKTNAPAERLILGQVGNSEGGDVVDGGGVEVAKKSGKSNGQKTSKSQKSTKSWKSSKSGKSKGKKSKKLSKSGNSPNFNVKDSEPSFLTPEARSAFNCLRLAFAEAPILWHFDPEYHI